MMKWSTIRKESGDNSKTDVVLLEHSVVCDTKGRGKF